ncbi:hypothetical protein GG344DRAFT_67705 [Lentinula edodes]|nr:hypothetical protein GG344DRAFT_67705 [Lentinula edodes]
MSSPPETDKQDLSASMNQKQGALSTEGFDCPANGALQTEWTIGEDRGSEDRQGRAGSEETDDRRATPGTKTVGEGLVKDGGHEQDTGPSVEDSRRDGESFNGSADTAGTVVESPKKTKKKAGGQAAPKVRAKTVRKSEVGGEKGPSDAKQKPRTRGSTASPAARTLASTLSAATMDHDESGDEPLATSLLLSPMSEAPDVIVDSLGNATMEARVEKEYGINLDMSSVSKVVQVASKLKKTAIAVGGWQMEMRNAFRDETSTLRQDLSKLEERVARVEKGQVGSEKAGEFVLRPELVLLKSRVQNVEKVALKMPTGSEIDGRLAVALKGVKEDMAGTCSGIQGEMRALRGIVKNDVKVVSKEARDDGRAVRAELKGEIQRVTAATKESLKEIQGRLRQETESRCNEQKKKAEAYTAKVEDVVKDLMARIEVLERQNRELEGKNRDLEQRVERVAQEKRQEEEAQVERMSERAREVMGYGAQRKRLGEDEMTDEGRSGKFPRGNSAESVHDMGGRGNEWSTDNRGSGHNDYRRNDSHTRGNYQHDQQNQGYGAPLPRLARPPAFAPTAPARDKQELKLAIGVFRGQYATAGMGDQIALIAKSVPRSVIPRDVRRDEYRFGVLVMTFRSYHDRDAFTREWSAGYKNSPSEQEGLKLRGIGEDF